MFFLLTVSFFSSLKSSSWLLRRRRHLIFRDRTLVGYSCVTTKSANEKWKAKETWPESKPRPKLNTQPPNLVHFSFLIKERCRVGDSCSWSVSHCALNKHSLVHVWQLLNPPWASDWKCTWLQHWDLLMSTQGACALISFLSYNRVLYVMTIAVSWTVINYTREVQGASARPSASLGELISKPITANLSTNWYFWFVSDLVWFISHCTQLNKNNFIRYIDSNKMHAKYFDQKSDVFLLNIKRLHCKNWHLSK